MDKWITRHKGVLGLLLLAIMALGIPASLGLTWVQNSGILAAGAVVYGADAPIMDRIMARAMGGVYGDRIAVCDGTADDVEINVAIAGLTSGRDFIQTVRLAGGFTLADHVTMASYTRIDAAEANIYWDTEVTTHEAAFIATGTADGASYTTTLAANADSGDTVLTVAEGGASKFAVGNYVLVKDETVTVIEKNGEIHRVVDANETSNTVTIDKKLWLSYTTAATGTVQRISAVHDIAIEGGTIIGASATQSKEVCGLWFTYCADFWLRAMHVEKMSDRAVFLVSCVQGEVSGCDIWGSARTGVGYGLVTSAACNTISFVDNRVTYCRHCVAGGEYSAAGYYGCEHGLLFDHNYFEGGLEGAGAALVDMHPSNNRNLVYNNNILIGPEDADYQGFYIGGVEWSASGNMVRVAGPAFADRDNYCKRVELRDNLAFGGYGAYLDSTALEYVVVDGLDCPEAMVYYAVYSDTGAAGAKCHLSNIRAPYGNTGGSDLIYLNDYAYVTVDDCKLFSGQRCGISIEDAQGGAIQDNLVANCDQAEASSAGNRAGVYLATCTHFLVTGNHCFDDQDTPTQRYGIEEGAGSDNNTFYVNKAWGNVVDQVLKAGASSVEEHSDETG